MYKKPVLPLGCCLQCLPSVYTLPGPQVLRTLTGLCGQHGYEFSKDLTASAEDLCGFDRAGGLSEVSLCHTNAFIRIIVFDEREGRNRKQLTTRRRSHCFTDQLQAYWLATRGRHVLCTALQPPPLGIARRSSLSSYVLCKTQL